MGRGSRPAAQLGALLRALLLVVLLLLLLPPPPTRALAPRISLPLGKCWGDPRGARAGVGGQGEAAEEGPLTEVAVTKDGGREGVCRTLGVHYNPSSFPNAAGREGGRENRGELWGRGPLSSFLLMGREGVSRPLCRSSSPLGRASFRQWRPPSVLAGPPARLLVFDADQS